VGATTLTVGWNGISKAFCTNWSWTVILPILTSWVARITSVSHCTWPKRYHWMIFKKYSLVNSNNYDIVSPF
jgi:hypothetical protein